MTLLRYRPAAPLSRYVDCIWWSQREMPFAASEHMLPAARANLVIALHDEPLTYRQRSSNHAVAWRRSLVHGPQWSYYIAGPKPSGMVAGVSFRPGGAGALLGVCARELADLHISLDDLWGSRARRLRERLMSAPNAATVFEILERELVARVHAPLLMHPAIAQALRASWLRGRIRDVQRGTGYSPRHFIALFTAATGVTPKHYFRIQRFNEAARQLASAPGDLAAIAAAVGYSDQAHFTREFRELAGVTPGRYRGRPDSPLHHREQVKNLQSSGRRSIDNGLERVTDRVTDGGGA